jgi:hypothetical protein
MTEKEIQSLAAQWYRRLDEHAPAEAYRGLVADAGLELRFPEGTFYGWDGFQQWYDRVIRLFFDESHALRSVHVARSTADEAQVQVVVRWEASVWKPPAAASQRIILDAFQTWTVKIAPATGKPVIATYIVDRLEYAEGSAKL